MKKLLAAVAMVILATPAFAAIQDVKVSGDITTTFLDRNDFDLGETLGTEDKVEGVGAPADPFQRIGDFKQNVWITQTRVRIDADLSDNVSTTVGIINERAWNAENSPAGSGTSNPGASSNVDNLDTDIQLYLASITLREFLYSPLTVTIGRQDFVYGNGFILGQGGPINQATGNLEYIAQDLSERTEYDGVKMVLDYKPLTIDLIYFKNEQQLLNGNVESDQSSSDVFGYNVNYQSNDPMSTVFETYMFGRVNDNASAEEASAISGTGIPTVQYNKDNTLFVPGLRASTNPVKGLNLQAEVAWQLGQVPIDNTVGGHTYQEAEKRDAMGVQLMSSYALPVLTKYKPTVNASWTYVSGDKDGASNYGTVPYSSAKVYTAWDPFNESVGAGTIYNTLFQLSNMNIVSVGATVNPLEDVTANFTWSGLWAATPYGADNALSLYQPDGGSTLYFPQTKNKNTNLGSEYDINLTYNYTEDVTFGVSLGWFVPGDVFTSNNDNVAQQAMADVNVKF